MPTDTTEKGLGGLIVAAMTGWREALVGLLRLIVDAENVPDGIPVAKPLRQSTFGIHYSNRGSVCRVPIGTATCPI